MNNKRLFFITCVFVITFSISLSLVSITLGRYYSTVSSDDNSRVALWGVSIDLDSDDIFQKQYKKSDSTIVVKSESLVVAPGTSGSATITISGVSEVKSKFMLAFSATNDVFLKSGTYLDYTTDDKDKQSDVFLLANDYYPLVFTLTVQENDGLVKELKQGKLSEVADALNNYQTTYYDSKVFNAAEDIKTTFVLSWTWSNSLNDKADTWLGATYAKGSVDDGLVLNADYSHSIEYEFEITVIQVD